MLINRLPTRFWIGFNGLLLLLVGLPCGVTWRAWSQTQHDQALLTAIHRDDTATALNELQRGANPNSSIPDYAQNFGAFLRHWVQQIVKGKSVPTRHGLSALTLAVEKNNTPVVEALLANGARDMGEQLRADNGISDFESVPCNLLIYAARKGNPEIVTMLIHHGSNVLAADADGETALCYAENAATIEALAAGGADVNAIDKYGSSIVSHYVYRDNLENLQALLTYHPKDRSVLSIVVHRDYHGECMQTFLAAGWDIDTPQEQGWTPLMLSLYSPARLNTTIAMLLIRKGANVNFCVKDGTTPLLLAADGGRYPPMDDASPTVVQMLLDHGAKINAKDAEGLTPLMIASWRLRPVLVRQLLRQGANVNTHAKDGRTALSMARNSPYKENHRQEWPLVMHILKRAGAK